MSQFSLDLDAAPRPPSREARALVDDLNPPQREAVVSCDGPVLILAGAGSGKTRALTRKVAWLVAERGFEPWQILAVTFTNKAAAEMRERCAHLLGPRAADLWLGTFHSIGVRVLRRHGDLVGVPRGFVIYDQADQLTMIGRCLAQLNLSDKSFPTRAVASYINEQKRECRGPEHPEVPIGSFIEQRHHQLYTLYEQEMRRAGAVDFADLIWLPYRLVTERPEIAFEYQSRWRYVLVDEFQDTNRAQYKLLQAILNPERRICVVGDDDQSIYRWRGAEVANILGFDKDFPGAVVVRLEQNYRSSKNILDLSGALIAENRTRHGKRLWTERPGGELVRVYPAQSERDEAEYVAGRISELRGEYSLSEMAIFYRTNAQSRAFEDGLRSRAIPYRVVGGLKFYDRAEIKDVLAYLKLLVNPSDVVALERVINRPARGIGKTTVQRCGEAAAARGVTLWEAVCALAAEGGAVGGKLAPFVELIVELKALAADATALATTEAVLERTGYLAHLEEDRSVEGQTRVENVKELLGALGEFSERATDRTLAAFLDEVALISDLDGVDLGDQTVSLMTVHTAKGLEFDVVFVSGMEEGLMPHFNSSDTEAGVEEERRLCYVAMTRARHLLHLSYASSRRRFGLSKPAVASRFFDGLPSGLMMTEGGGYQRTAPSWSRPEAYGGVRPTPAWGGGATPSWGARATSGAPDRARRPAEPDVCVDPLPDYEGESQDPSDGLGRGSRVFHTKFGEGRVLEVIGEGERGKAKVMFADGVTRKMMINVLTLI